MINSELLTLRPYQEVVLEKFADLDNVAICDDMGLGKTVEAIALDLLRREQLSDLVTPLPTLVIAPLTGVVESWTRHYIRHTDLQIARLGKPTDNSVSAGERAKFLSLIKNNMADVFIMHYEAARIMGDDLAKIEWGHVILDEAHKIKNRKAKVTQAVKEFKKVKYRTICTGTPVDKTSNDWWSLIDWLFPTRRAKQKQFGDDYRLFTSYWRFYENFVSYIETEEGYHVIVGPKNEDILKELIEPFYIRRGKRDPVVAANMPDVENVVRKVSLHPKQRKVYDEMERDMVSWLENEDFVSASIVIAQIQRLQQFALGMPITDGQGNVIRIDKPSTKLDAFMDIMQDRDPDAPVVVFSQFAKVIDMIEATASKKYTVATITGKTPQGDRQGIIDDFQSGKYDIIACTIKSGGVGIELTRADTVIFFDRDWSPAANEQALSRVDRSGQKNPVTVIDLVAEDTIDKIRNRQIKTKQGWIDAITGG